MKQYCAIFILLLSVLASRPAPFINLDFELADTSEAQTKIINFPNQFLPEPLLFGTGSAAKLLPGWTVMLGEMPTDIAALDNGPFDTLDPFRVPTYAALLTTGNLLYSLESYNFHNAAVEGRYALLLDTSRAAATGSTRVAAVTQTGAVPEEARFLTFRVLANARIAINDSGFETAFLPSDASDPSRRFLDVTAWAGQTVKLTIALAHEDAAAIDSLVFVVPEPGTVVLLSLGAVSLALAMRRRKR